MSTQKFATISVILCYVASASLPPERISFSPKTWAADDFQRLEALSLLNTRRQPKPLAFSDGKGMVAGTGNGLAVYAGKEALRKGGNAMDACLTTILTEITLDAGSRASYAGTANILYFDSSTGDTYNIDGGWNKPHYLDPHQIPEHHSEQSNGASVLVPGFIAAVSTASEKYGLLPLTKLLEPAMYFATKGFRLPAELAKEIKMNYNPSKLLRTKEGKYIFTNPMTGKLYKAGERFRQPKLAKFLKRLAKHGKDYFYRGTWAEEIVETVQSQNGYVTMEDMAEYDVGTPEPASAVYHRYHIMTSGAERGGAELVEKLNLMEMAGISGSTDSYLTNATKFFWLASIARLSSFISFFSHDVPNGKQLLEEHFSIEVDDSYRKTKEYAEELWDKISSVERMRDINELMREIVESIEMDMERHDHGSSGVVAVDRAGNVCSLMHGTDSGRWGSGLFVQGVSLPSPGIAMKSFLKTSSGGPRVPSRLQPVIAFKEAFPDFTLFGRRLKRSAAEAKKHLKHKGESFKRRQHKRQKIQQQLVVFRTPNLVRTHMEGKQFAQSTQARQLTRPRTLDPERLFEQIKIDENDHDEAQEDHGYLVDGPSLEELTNEEDANVPFRAKSTTIETELEDITSTNHQPLTRPWKPIAKEHEEEATHAATNHGNHPKNEEVENEMEGENESKARSEERKGRRKEALTKESESREFPHLGLPIAWKPDVIPEERGEPAFHTNLVPALALTCVGPSNQFVIPQYLTNLLESGINPKAALEAPTFFAPSALSFQQDIQVEKYSIDDNILKKVRELGQPLTEVNSQTAEDLGGSGTAIVLKNDWEMFGGVHPSREGIAEGVAVLEGYMK